MLQFSVYARHCASYENLEVHVNRVKTWLPPDGYVRLLTFTDKQFQKQLVFSRKIRAATPPPAEQLTLFYCEKKRKRLNLNVSASYKL